METKERLHKEVDNGEQLESEIPLKLLQYLSSEGCNFQNICRLCLSASNESLYSIPNSEGSLTAEQFQAMTSIYINSDDDVLPSRICSNCQTELVNYYKFRKKCEKSEYILQSLLRNGLKIKEEPKSHTDAIYNRENEERNNHSECVDYQEVLDNISSEASLIDKVHSYLDSNDYHDDLKNILSEDEALCIVQDTIKNEKKFTIYERGTEALTEMIFPKTRNKKRATVQFQCMFCHQEFRNAKQLEAHQGLHVNEHLGAHKHGDPYPCKDCKESFRSEFDLNLHCIVHSTGPWTCTFCSKQFQEKPALRRHIQRHMHAKRHACDACGKAFVEKYALKRHSRVHTGERPVKKHACPDCDKRFTDSGQLMAHMAHHNGDKPFQCVVCGKSFPSARLLRSHRLVHSDHKPYACEYCDKRFRHESTRNTHHRTHTGEKPYVCSICGKSFIQGSNLSLHMRTHTGEKPYSCSQCDSRFSSGSTLKAHLRTHTGERPYKCKVCGKSFARVNMKLHMRLHSGERPFACSACPKRYVSAAHLRSHCRAHTGEKPFECAKCQSKFATKTLLIKHLHSKENDTTKSCSKQKNKHSELSNTEVITVPVEQIDDEIPNAIVELTLGTHETLDLSQELVFQESSVKTHVILLGSSNSVSFSCVNLAST